MVDTDAIVGAAPAVQTIVRAGPAGTRSEILFGLGGPLPDAFGAPLQHVDMLEVTGDDATTGMESRHLVGVAGVQVEALVVPERGGESGDDGGGQEVEDGVEELHVAKGNVNHER